MSVAVPKELPVAIPLLKPMVSTAVLLLAHVPPVVASDKVVVKPTHTVMVPVMADGSAFTVTVAVMKQPLADV